MENDEELGGSEAQPGLRIRDVCIEGRSERPTGRAMSSAIRSRSGVSNAVAAGEKAAPLAPAIDATQKGAPRSGAGSRPGHQRAPGESA